MTRQRRSGSNIRTLSNNRTSGNLPRMASIGTRNVMPSR